MFVSVALLCSTASQCPLALGSAPATAADVARASHSQPGAAYVASDAAAIRQRLNTHLRRGPLALPSGGTPCEAFALADLHAIQYELACAADGALTARYGGGDKRAPPHAGNATALLAEHAAEAAEAAAHPAVSAAARDARCHEIAMAWTHHLGAPARAALRAQERALPLLPVRGAEHHMPELSAGGASHAPQAKRLAAAVTCQIGHQANKTAAGTWEGFPHWPYEVTYNASGYGPYPFWTLGGGTGAGTLSGPGAPIRTWWSAVQNAERLDHSSCNLAGLGGAAKVACTHLFLDDAYAYLYTANGFCCQSSAPAAKDRCHLTRPQRDFMDVFDYKGVLANYTSEDGRFSGPAKQYTMHLTNPSDFWFWYVTDMDGRPIEQGEGPCEMYSAAGTRACSGPPKMLFHQYHPGSFQAASIDPSVFALPDVCKNATGKLKTCFVEPTNFCSADPLMDDDEAKAAAR
jgi:hypothetical protein